MVYLQRCLIVTWLVPRETAAVSARSVYILSRHFIQRYIRKVYTCLAVTCHLYLWQNNRDLLRATALHGGGTDTEIRVGTES